jgi:capsule biosynthesis phosphatase
MNRELQSVSLDTTLPHLVRKKIHTVLIDRPTRGAVETAYLGLQKAQFSEDTPICF